METLWFFRLRFRRTYESAYDYDFRVSQGHKRSYDSDSDSVASESQPLLVKTAISFTKWHPWTSVSSSIFFFFYQQLFIVCSTSKGRDQVPCTLREGTYFSTSSTQHIWELITIKICLCVHTFGSCCARNLTTERWKANDTFGYQHRDGLCWSGGGGQMSECRTCCGSLIWFPTSGTKTTRKELADFLKPLLFKLSKQLPSFRKQILYRSHQCAVR